VAYGLHLSEVIETVVLVLRCCDAIAGECGAVTEVLRGSKLSEKYRVEQYDIPHVAWSPQSSLVDLLELD
jgi:hypothetical protein